jgi:ribosomal protein S18 acetylase RimI-like enzyme
VSAAVEVRPTIDRLWLERAATTDPLAHAYALWDLDRSPQDVRFASAVRGEETVGYLLVWLGRRDRPVVHWFGDPRLAGRLVGALPRPPFVAVVPPDAEPLVAQAFPGVPSAGLRLMLRERGRLPRPGSAVRRLRREDREALAELVRAHGAPELGAYATLDPEREPAWGVVERGRLTGVARAGVRLPGLWLVTGVFVAPAFRNRGWGLALVAAVVDAAEEAGAPTGLYVRDDEPAARRIYDRLGFREVGRRRWLDVRGSPSS